MPEKEKMEEEASDQAALQASNGPQTALNPKSHPLQVALYYTLQFLHNILAKTVFLGGTGRMRLSELRAEFERRVGRPVPVQAVGYGSLRELVCSFDDLFVVTRDMSFPLEFDLDDAYVIKPQPQPAFFIILLELVHNPDKYNFSPSIGWTPSQPLEEGSVHSPQDGSSSSFPSESSEKETSPSPVGSQIGEPCEAAISPPLKKRKKSSSKNVTTSCEKAADVEGKHKAEEKVMSKLLFSPSFLYSVGREIFKLFKNQTNASALSSATLGQAASFKTFRVTWTERALERKTYFPKLSEILKRLSNLGIIKIGQNGPHIVVCEVKAAQLRRYGKLKANVKKKAKEKVSSPEAEV